MIFNISAGGMTRPVGLFGELMMRRRVLSVIVFRTASAVRTKSVGSVSMKTLFARQNVAISGIVTQYGFGISTSSPGFSSVQAALNKACLPPHEAATCDPSKGVKSGNRLRKRTEPGRRRVLCQALSQAFDRVFLDELRRVEIGLSDRHVYNVETALAERCGGLCSLQRRRRVHV
jgi:hypothetical protein